jgi:hypothetical protein
MYNQLSVENVSLKHKIERLSQVISNLVEDNQKLMKIGNIIHEAPFELSDSHKVELIEKILKGRV